MNISNIVHVLFICSLVIGSSCESISEISAKGFIGPYRIETTVDHQIARYYLEHQKESHPEDSSYIELIRQIEQEFDGTIPDTYQLKSISDKTSVDFATIFYCRKLISLSKNISIQEKFLHYLASARSGHWKPVIRENTAVILVPGFDYEATGSQSGANLLVPQKVISDLGVEVHFVDINPLGSVAENAQYLKQYIQNFKGTKDLIIAGPSSAGPAIHMTLGGLLSLNEVSKIKAWLNLGGIIGGSKILEWIDSGVTSGIWKYILWHHDWSPESFNSLKPEVSKQRLKQWTLPGHIQVVNYLGSSLSGQITNYAKDNYRIMRSMGPNDGLALLPDLIYEDGYTILAAGSDHFFAEDPELRLKSQALLAVMLDLIQINEK